MCGIVGYVGSREVMPVLVKGLRRLEYRGYDSAGIAGYRSGQLLVFKAAGRLDNLEARINGAALVEKCGIGHTRWATHGSPSDTNAHPHTDCSGSFAVVHNGIIENYAELRRWLAENGHILHSDTDTEVIPHLIEHYYSGDLVDAVRKAVQRLKGSYAIAVISKDHPDHLVAVRQDSPLIVGLGESENFLASDIPAVLEYTRSVYILEDGEVALVTADRVEVYTIEGQPVRKKLFKVEWDPAMAEKEGYEHFMLKEIHEQPQAVKETMRGRIDPHSGTVVLDELSLTPSSLASIDNVVLIAAGTAFHAGLVGKFLIEKLARIPVMAEVASEFRYMDPMVDDKTLALVISQSGETADTLAAMREAKRRGAHVLAVTNVLGSSVSREADDVIYTWAGPEIAVASTKAYTAQLVVMYLIALYLAQHRGQVDSSFVRRIGSQMQQLGDWIKCILVAHEERIKEYGYRWKDKEHVFFIGRGVDSCTALEGQLKLKEISYVHAEALAAGELKHGTLALIEEGVPVVALATQSSLFDKMMSNMREVKARGANILALTVAGNEQIKEVTKDVIFLPKADDLLLPVLSVIPLQLLAYYAAVARGCDVDKPRHLAKSVTVE